MSTRFSKGGVTLSSAKPSACQNCGASGHSKANCLERPSKSLFNALQASGHPSLVKRPQLPAANDVPTHLIEAKGKRSKHSLAYEEKHDSWKNYVSSPESGNFSPKNRGT